MRSRIARRNHTPNRCHSSKIQRWPDSRDKQIRRQLHQQVSDEEDRSRKVKVCPGHAQILFKGAFAGLRKVRAVEKVEEVGEDEEREEMQVDLAKECLVCFLDPFLIGGLEVVEESGLFWVIGWVSDGLVEMLDLLLLERFAVDGHFDSVAQRVNAVRRQRERAHGGKREQTHHLTFLLAIAVNITRPLARVCHVRLNCILSTHTRVQLADFEEFKSMR